MDLTQAQTWVELVPAILVAVALLLVPGAVLARVLGLRGMAVWGAAAPISVSVIAVSAIITPRLGLHWSLWCLLIGWAVALALVVVLRRVIRRMLARRPASVACSAQPVSAGPDVSRPMTGAWRRGVIPGLLALIAAVVLISTTFFRLVPDAEYIMQLFDTTFHLNAVRAILDSGDGSSLTLWSITNKANNSSFYPAAWHDVVALVAQLSGIGVPQATNVVALVVSAVIWPLGAIWLAQAIGGPNLASSLAGGLLSACFPAFPWLFLHWGPLYPNLLGNSLIAAALALTLSICRQRPDSVRHRLNAAAALLLVLPGLALAHPNSLLAAVGFAAMIVFATLGPQLHRLRAGGGEAGVRGASGETLVDWLGVRGTRIAIWSVAGVFVLLWGVLRTGLDVAPWKADENLRDALADIVTNGPVDRPAAIAVSVLALIGLVRCLRSRRWWPIIVFGFTVVLYLVVVASPVPLLRDVLTAGFYRDPKRIAGLTVFGFLPLAVIGFTTVWALVTVVVMRIGPKHAHRLSRSAQAMRRAVAGVLLLMLAAVLVLPIRNGAIAQVVSWAQRDYVIAPTSKLLNTDERDVLTHLRDFVPTGQTVLVDPGNGGALAYAFENVPVTRVHILSDVPDDLQTLDWHLSDASWKDRTCPIVRANDLHFVLDFGDAIVDNVKKPGLSDIPSEVGTVVYSQGRARLVELTGCWE